MPMPDYLPRVEPVIPEGLVFIAITLTDPDAPVAIMGFPTIRRDTPDGTPYVYPASQENVDAECAKARFDVASWRIISYSDIPKDRTYRDALKDVAGVIAHDLDRARDIHRQHLRVHRAPRLAALDIEYQRADEAKDLFKKDQIAAQKQRLRDLPADPAIDAAETLGQLKAFWPEELG